MHAFIINISSLVLNFNPQDFLKPTSVYITLVIDANAIPSEVIGTIF